MKAIELTEEHKAKLLEMCKVLFPKRNIRFTVAPSAKPAFKKDYISYDIDFATGDSIHWFEFCLELCQRLATTYPKNFIAVQPNFNYVTVHYKFWNEDSSKIHPIDYLYEEFKKLK